PRRRYARQDAAEIAARRALLRCRELLKSQSTKKLGTLHSLVRCRCAPFTEEAMGFFTKDIKTLDDLFVHTLRDIYYAENQIAKNLPDMIEKATDQSLKNGFETHLAETKGQIVRIEKVFQMHGVDAKGVTCPAIDGILKEASEVAGEVDDKSVL